MEKTYIKGILTKSEDGKTYKVIASTSAVDRQGDSIDQNGWELDNYMKNPVILWAHDYSALPIGKATLIDNSEGKLVISYQFASAEGNPIAQQIKTLVDEGIVNASSVGFIPKEKQGNKITKQELLELSLVPVPANQEALMLAIKSIDGNKSLNALEKDMLKETLSKGEVADELDAEEAWEAKYKNWCEFCDIISALWTVYFDQETPVQDFGKLLTEAIGLMSTLADGEAADEEASKGLIAKAFSPEAVKNFVDFTAKSGRTLSKKTLSTMDAAVECMKTAISTIEDLKAQAEKDDETEEVETESKETDEVEVVKYTSAAEMLGLFNSVRQSTIATKQSSETTLAIINSVKQIFEKQ